MIKKVKAIVSRVELRNHIQAKRNAKECATMDAATRKSYEDAIEQYTVTISELEHSEDWDIVGNYRECLEELKGEYEELQTEAGWAQYLEHHNKGVAGK